MSISSDFLLYSCLTLSTLGWSSEVNLFRWNTSFYGLWSCVSKHYVMGPFHSFVVILFCVFTRLWSRGLRQCCTVTQQLAVGFIMLSFSVLSCAWWFCVAVTDIDIVQWLTHSYSHLSELDIGVLLLNCNQPPSFHISNLRCARQIIASLCFVILGYRFDWVICNTYCRSSASGYGPNFMNWIRCRLM